MMLNTIHFKTVKNQLKEFVKILDSSTRLLFAQNMSVAKTRDGNSLIELLFDVFEEDLIEILDLSDKTRDLIEGSHNGS
jgi:hypothetical protein